MCTDYDSWLTFGVSSALRKCYHNLCVISTFFNTKPQNRVSWRHHRSKHGHQLDLILTRHPSLHIVKLTRNYQSSDCDTDHTLGCSKMKLRENKSYRIRNEYRPRIDTSKTHHQEKVEEFVPGPPSDNARERWKHYKDAVYNAYPSSTRRQANRLSGLRFTLRNNTRH